MFFSTIYVNQFFSHRRLLLTILFCVTLYILTYLIYNTQRERESADIVYKIVDVQFKTYIRIHSSICATQLLPISICGTKLKMEFYTQSRTSLSRTLLGLPSANDMRDDYIYRNANYRCKRQEIDSPKQQSILHYLYPVLLFRDLWRAIWSLDKLRI